MRLYKRLNVIKLESVLFSASAYKMVACAALRVPTKLDLILIQTIFIYIVSLYMIFFCSF